MDERATHARLHKLYTRLHPETGDHAMTWREGLRSLLEALEVDQETPPWERDFNRAAGLGAPETEVAPGSAGGPGPGSAGPGGIMGAAGPGQPPTT